MALTPDTVTVNTELAEKYLEKYNNFDAWPSSNKYWRVKNYPNEKEEFTIDDAALKIITEHIPFSAARRLVEKIKEHESTFYQLEYLIRKTEKADFQNQLLLLCQHLLCDGCWNGQVIATNIIMTEKMPFYVLGCLAVTKPLSSGYNIITTTQKMAPICHLFYDLCTEVGWTINLHFVNDVNYFEKEWQSKFVRSIFDENAAYFGITGVVTESADIDSALDVFINSSVTAPWKLERIYVQESVFDEVKEALAARCGREEAPGCGGVFPGRGKVLACEALGGRGPLVPLEAYRTARELGGLLRPAPALSLWAADAALAHELALAAPATLVWLNDYASFHGPPASSLPLYRLLYPDTPLRLNEASYRNLEKCWTDWSRLTRNQRVDSILNALQDLSSAPEGYDSVVDFRDAVLNVRDESFVSVDDGKICFGVKRPPAPLFENCINFYANSKKQVANFIIATIDGMAVVYTDTINDTVTKDLLKSLEKAGVPLTCSNNETPVKNLKIKILRKNLKVIRSNFGTIFAN